MTRQFTLTASGLSNAQRLSVLQFLLEVLHNR